VRLLDKTYETSQEMGAAFGTIFDFYRDNYTDLYDQRRGEIQAAVEELQQIYQQTHFPFMNAYWNSYPDNIGHLWFPGCFRCHDGKHLDADGQAIRLACDLCHDIPQVAEPGNPLPAVDLGVQDVPQSHQSTLWLAEHRFAFSYECATCHTVENAGGSDDSSFCSNSACHGREWKYIDFETAQIQQRVAPPWPPAQTERPPAVPHPMVQHCRRCHGLGELLPFPQDHADYNAETCNLCHPFG